MIQSAREHVLSSRRMTMSRPSPAAPQASKCHPADPALHMRSSLGPDEVTTKHKRSTPADAPHVERGATLQSLTKHLSPVCNKCCINKSPASLKCVCALQVWQIADSAAGSQAVASFAAPVLDAPADQAEVGDHGDPSQEDLHEASNLAAAHDLTLHTDSSYSANAGLKDRSSSMQLVPSRDTAPSRGASNVKGRPASAAGFSTLHPPSRTFSGTSRRPDTAVAAVSSPEQHLTQHDAASVSNRMLQQSLGSALDMPTREGNLSDAVSRQASQTSQTSHREAVLGGASISRFSLRRPIKLTLLPNEGVPQDAPASPATARPSPKATLLRDQHMPGELLHQKSAFPSDVFKRHEAARASPSSPPSQPLPFSSSGRPSSPLSTRHRTHSDTHAHNADSDAAAAAAGRPTATLLRNQHLPGEPLHQRSAFPSDIYMQHDAACIPGLTMQSFSDGNAVLSIFQKQQSSPVKSSDHQQLQSSGTILARGAHLSDTLEPFSLPRTVSFAAAFMEADNGSMQTEHEMDKGKIAEAEDNSFAALGLAAATAPTVPVTDSKAALEAALLQSRHRGATLSAASSLTKARRESSQRLKPSLKKSDSRLNQARQESPRSPPKTPRSRAGPWFEATSRDLTRGKSWAKEWFQMGVQDGDAFSPEFTQLQQQSLQQQ